MKNPKQTKPTSGNLTATEQRWKALEITLLIEYTNSLVLGLCQLIELH